MSVNIISRQHAEAIIREQVISKIFQNAPEKSTFMSLAKKLPNMTSNQTRMRVLDALPMAYWVNGDRLNQKVYYQPLLRYMELLLLNPLYTLVFFQM